MCSLTPYLLLTSKVEVHHNFFKHREQKDGNPKNK
jgi:hypothetical protein